MTHTRTRCMRMLNKCSAMGYWMILQVVYKLHPVHHIIVHIEEAEEPMIDSAYIYHATMIPSRRFQSFLIFNFVTLAEFEQIHSNTEIPLSILSAICNTFFPFFSPYFTFTVRPLMVLVIPFHLYWPYWLICICFSSCAFLLCNPFIHDCQHNTRYRIFIYSDFLSISLSFPPIPSLFLWCRTIRLVVDGFGWNRFDFSQYQFRWVQHGIEIQNDESILLLSNYSKSSIRWSQLLDQSSVWHCISIDPWFERIERSTCFHFVTKMSQTRPTTIVRRFNGKKKESCRKDKASLMTRDNPFASHWILPPS